MLRDSSLSKHNVMVARKEKAGCSNNEGKEERPAKRLKQEDATPPDDSELASIDAPSSRTTDLETALPPISTDKEAIEAYETSHLGQNSESLAHEPQWIPGQRSIYVDAFNLALDTVLEDESHLFDDAERSVFEAWRGLNYEAQYLYVRLFLRKTSAWHRINRLGYHSDISDLPRAINTLQSSRKIPPPTVNSLPVPRDFDQSTESQLGHSFAFADDSTQSITTLDEASSLLLLDELKALAKDAKVQGKTKRELLQALRRTSGKQSGLTWSSLKRSETEESTLSTTSPSVDQDSREATPQQNRDLHFVEKILAETGPCVRLSVSTLRLFERVHLVFYRSTEWTEKSLKTIILARMARWKFPEYLVCRSANIFPSRLMLLEFEASLRIQFYLDNLLEFNGTPSQDTLQTILDIFEQVTPRWRDILRDEERKEDSIYVTGEGAYLRRLSPAWVYTRIIHKGAYVLGKLKDHKREHETLTELLDQKLFHTSRRGDWYQRKALLEEHYMPALSPNNGLSEENQKKHWKRISLHTCEEGLEDRLVHLMYHHDLQKRVIKLEKALRVPKREQHDFSHVRLAKPAERTFYGTQIQRPDQVAADTRRGGKTIWIDPGENENEGECSVEAMCLSNYRSLGYRGFHSEGGIVRTLFAYLFFDILFIYIPDVFQTPYQTCPLDLHTDAFFPSRMSEINQRLNQINNGDAHNLIQQVWDEHHEKRTCIVGLDWSFELEDLLSIAMCFPPAALSTVCKVMAQEYGQRGGGVPDLFLWRESSGGEGEVMFAEVKSENDRLSDTQRLWIDVLTGAGITVELCNALASETKITDR